MADKEKKRPKPSGTFYRKRKAEMEKEDQKQAKVMSRFFSNPENSVEVEFVASGGEHELQETESNIPQSSDADGDAGGPTEHLAVVSASTSRSSLFLEDCAAWPTKIMDEVRQVIVEKGPVQVKNFDFPTDKVSNRRFTVANYKTKLPNGEEINREWLVYSKSKNSIFCFVCKLFSNENLAINGTEGYSDWQNMSTYLRHHEKSPSHIKSSISHRELVQRLRLGKTIDEENQRIIKSETEHWHEVLKRILSIVQFLGSQGLALRGTNDTIFKENNGNFLKLVEHIAKFDTVLSEHLRRVTSKETHVHYLSKQIQNEFIALLSSKVNEYILSEVKKAVYYSIILDCTPDVSRKEQMTMVVRFVQTEAGQEVVVKEHFLGFVEVCETTGEGLLDCLLDELSKRQIPLQNMRGQGYDNGSNMKGKNLGVQKRILDLNPRAFYVPCGSHSLNLVVNDAALSCITAVNFFGIVQEIYNFFSGSTHRWSILTKHVTNLTVKPLSETRWESRIDALQPLRYYIEQVYDAVYEATTDKKTDAFGKSKAIALAKKLTDFKFLCSLVTWYEVLFKINLVSKTLQKKEVNLPRALDLIGSVKTFLNSMRSENGLNSVITDAKELAEKLEITPEFSDDVGVRPRKRKTKKQFSYEGADEPVKSGKETFKVNFFYFVLDTAINSLSERFELMENHSKHFHFLYDMKALETCEKDQIKKQCEHLETVLTVNDRSDINGEELLDEILILSPMLPQQSCPEKTLSYITKNTLVDIFPNLFVALRILLTIPVTVASGERSFSKLKIIKNYLRSTISQDRLSGLATLAIEKEILESIETDPILKDFATLKARKVCF